MNIKSRLSQDLLIFDGAMGTMLQKNGLEVGELPELFNFTNKEIISKIHQEYVLAGADIITTNTFGANKYKLKDSGYTVSEVVKQAVDIAKEAANKKAYVALDVGPSGKMMKPSGELSFDQAYELIKEQVIAGEDADLVLMETFSDLHEAKAGILAVKENSDLPVFCSMTFQEDGRTLMGTDPLTAVNVLQDLGLDAIGINCSLGPNQLLPIIEEMLKYATIPVFVQPNAGLPHIVDGETCFEIDIEEYVEAIEKMIDLGVHVVGGCCGTNPEFIKALKNKVGHIKPKQITAQPITAVSSSTKTVILDNRVRIIGERINPTGKKKLKEALKAKNITYIIDEAISQKECGADILDVNMGLPEIDEKEMMCLAIEKISEAVDLPLQIDSTSKEVIEAAARIYNGKPLINSVNGKDSSINEVLPIAKKYGACLIALTLDDKGLPDTAEQRMDIADKIVKHANEYGINTKKLIFDCLTLTVAAQQDAAIATLDALKAIKEKYDVKTTLGASNISFGLPNRKIVNRTFMAVALSYGLDAPITDPTEKELVETIKAYEALSMKDVGSKDYVAYFENQEIKSEDIKIKEDKQIGIKDSIINGKIETVEEATKKALEEDAALEIVNKMIIPALEEVGLRYEKGKIFLPQLIKSAETSKKVFEILKQNIKSGEESLSYGKIAMATVKGDIHDIGKNIVNTLLENYGYEVIDLGKDVSVETIVKAVKEQNIKLVGLSALMTTTVMSMEDTIKALRKECPGCKVMVGGAVLNQEYADQIDADYYCKDAMGAVLVAKEVLRLSEKN